MASAKHSVDPLQASLFDVFAPPSLATKEPTSTLESEAPSPLAPNTTNAAPFAEPPAEISLEEPAGPFIYSVSQLSAELRDTLQHDFARVFVQGEICDFKGIHRSGHAYFGLKDAEAQIRAVMWRPTVQKTAFELKGGLEVIASGKIDYYPGSGSLQIVIDTLEPVGIGALQLKFEQLKEKLAREGLFDAARKRKISALNWRIGIVTGRSTAALQDMLKIFQLRFPLAEIYLFHAAVQGERAPQEIATAIELANRYSSHSSKALDLLIVGRGGGSYEDLFCFNDEIVARALAQSKIPTVSAVGHEIDFTIADMVADRRAATPTHAAQESVPDQMLWLDRLKELEILFSRRFQNRLSDYRIKIDTLANRLIAAAPQKKLQQQRELLLRISNRLETNIKIAIERRRSKIGAQAGILDALSPLKVLERGFALPKLNNGQVLRSVTEVKQGQEIDLQLRDGHLKTLVQ